MKGNTSLPDWPSPSVCKTTGSSVYQLLLNGWIFKQKEIDYCLTEYAFLGSLFSRPLSTFVMQHTLSLLYHYSQIAAE